MKILIMLILLVSAFEAFAQDERACTQTERQVIRTTKYRAAVLVDQLKTQLRERLNRNDMSWSDWRKLHISGNILHCARKKLGTLNFVCADNLPHDHVGYTIPIVTNKVYIDSSFFRMNHLPKSKEALLIHEATHHCGTNDALYLNISEPPRDARYIGWQVIADTYTYWAENHFCLPGEC